MILRGEKSWEMRKQRCKHRGPIALIEQGTGTVVGTATIEEDLPALSLGELLRHRDKHRIPPSMIDDVMRRGWVRPWVLGNVRQLARPIAYDHPSGAVGWVNLSSEVEAAVRAQSRYEYRSPNATTGSNPAMPALANPRQHASTSSRRRELMSEPYPSTPSGRLEMLGQFAAIAAALCWFAFVGHIILGALGLLSFFKAFVWLLPMGVSIIIAGALGQGEMFKDFTTRR